MNTVVLFAVASAVFYCIAMVAMKSWWTVPGLGLTVLIAITLLIAGAFEVAALRQERLGLIYVSIICAEVVIIGAASLFHFNESYSHREVTGIGLVLIGTAIAWS